MDSSFILSLIDKFNAGSVTELDFNDGTNRLSLRKGGAKIGAQARGEPLSDAETDAPIEPETAAASAAVTSPIVATFYASPGPDAPPFAVPGATIKTGETLCILEAMKMMNKLTAEFDMEILSVEAENGGLVEFGQVLFKVKPL